MDAERLRCVGHRAPHDDPVQGKLLNMLKHLRAILTLPFMVLIVIPTALILLNKSINPLWGQAFPVNLLLAVAGLGFVIAGLVLIVSTIRLFILVGQGTLAPWNPTQRLVVRGPYRYVRNPMISGVISVLLGEACLSGSPAVLMWALAVVVVNVVYIPLLEEPNLYQRFGDDYRDYVRHVPRWIPRLTAWSHP